MLLMVLLCKKDIIQHQATVSKIFNVY